jgi:hypothetical protein
LDKQSFLTLLEKRWTELRASCANLSTAQITQPGVTGGWSVKDILAHITTWEEEALKYLPIILRGARPPRYKDLYGGIDAFNARMTEQKRALSLSEIMNQMDATHRQLIAYINSSPEEMFTRETRFQRRLRLDTTSHYPIHAKVIRERWGQ